MSHVLQIFGSHAAAADFARWQYWLHRRVKSRLSMRREFRGDLYQEVDAGYCLDRPGL